MTISSVTSKVVYVGDETTSTFPYPFKIFNDEDLTVSRVDSTTLSVGVLTLNTDYTVTGAGNDGGGNVVLSAGYCAVHSGSQLVIQREMDLTQAVDYVENDPFPAETLETALDKLTMVDQQLQEQIARAIKADITQTTGNTTYTEVVTASVNAASSSATVALAQAVIATSSATVAVASELIAVDAAAQASASAASVSSGVTRALDNLTPTALNQSLVPGVSNNITLGSNSKLFSSAYVTLMSGSTLSVSGTGSITTLRATTLTSNTLNVSGTSSFVTVKTTLLTASTLNISGTVSAVTVTSTLVSSTSVNVSGTMNATNVKGDGSLLTGVGNFKVIAINRAMDAANGNVAYTGVGFQPKGLIILGVINSTNAFSMGFASTTVTDDSAIHSTDNNVMSSVSTGCFRIAEAGSANTKAQEAVVASYDVDGFTLTWTKTGSPASATANLHVLAFR